jgi:DNA-binding transcriptional MerR regulator
MNRDIVLGVLPEYSGPGFAMKPQQLANLLNLSPHTIRKWAREDFTEYLSPMGQGGGGIHRSFNDTDARIIAWIALMKAQNTPLNEIHLTLKAARSNDWRDLPPLPGGMANDEPIAVVPREAVEERFKALQERYETQLKIIAKERDELQTQLEVAKRETETAKRETEAVRRELLENVNTLQKRITDLSVQEAELRGKLEQYTFGGRRWNIGALIAVTLVAGVTFTIIVLVIVTLISRH